MSLKPEDVSMLCDTQGRVCCLTLDNRPRRLILEFHLLGHKPGTAIAKAIIPFVAEVIDQADGVAQLGHYPPILAQQEWLTIVAARFRNRKHLQVQMSYASQLQSSHNPGRSIFTLPTVLPFMINCKCFVADFISAH